MDSNQIKKIIEQNKDSIAFIIGNGINRYNNSNGLLSWDELLLKLWSKVSLSTVSFIPIGISVTEFYDMLDFENNGRYNLQEEFCRPMQEWKPKDHHKLIVDKIQSLNAPILTTNFEETFAKSIQCELYKIEKEGFTDYYPWSSYHGKRQMEKPIDGFGIWYINGMINYSRSIRLGLTHYMGSVQRSREMIHGKSTENLYKGKNIDKWVGYKTWLHLIFNKSLFIFGLGLEENETFLRWLLIERTRYFKKFPDQKYKSWYLTAKNNNVNNEGKKFYLQKLGFEIIEVDSYDVIYRDIWQ